MLSNRFIAVYVQVFHTSSNEAGQLPFQLADVVNRPEQEDRIFIGKGEEAVARCTRSGYQ